MEPTNNQVAASQYLAVKVIMMPRDTNPYGAIFGGVLLSYIDQAGSIGADHAIRSFGWPERPLATVAMNAVEFHHPVFVGDIVSFWTTVERVGVTSITMYVWAEAERERSPVKLTEARVTYVAVSQDGARRPTPIRPQPAERLEPAFARFPILILRRRITRGLEFTSGNDHEL